MTKNEFIDKMKKCYHNECDIKATNKVLPYYFDETSE